MALIRPIVLLTLALLAQERPAPTSVERAREEAKAARSLIDPATLDVPALDPGMFAYRPGGSAWSFAGAAGLSAAGSGFTRDNPPPPAGHQVAFLQGQGAATIAVAVPAGGAGAHRLELVAARRALSAAGYHDFAVEVDGAEVGRIRLESTGWSRPAAEFAIAAEGPHEVTLRGLNTGGGDNTSLIGSIVLLPLRLLPLHAGADLAPIGELVLTDDLRPGLAGPGGASLDLPVRLTDAGRARLLRELDAVPGDDEEDDDEDDEGPPPPPPPARAPPILDLDPGYGAVLAPHGGAADHGQEAVTLIERGESPRRWSVPAGTDHRYHYVPQQLALAGGPDRAAFASAGPLLAGRSAWTFALQAAVPTPGDWAAERGFGPCEVAEDGSYQELVLLPPHGTPALRVAGPGGSDPITVTCPDSIHGRRDATGATATLVDSGTRVALDITLDREHAWTQHEQVVLSGFGAPYDGTRVVTNATPTTVRVVIESRDAPEPTPGVVAGTGEYSFYGYNTVNKGAPPLASPCLKAAFAVVRDGDRLSWYKNGFLLGEATHPGLPAGPTEAADGAIAARLFRGFAAGAEHLAGELGPIRAHDAALPSADPGAWARLQARMSVELSKAVVRGREALKAYAPRFAGVAPRISNSYRYAWRFTRAGTDELIWPEDDKPEALRAPGRSRPYSSPDGPWCSQVVGDNDATGESAVDVRLTVITPRHDEGGDAVEPAVLFDGVIETIRCLPLPADTNRLYVDPSHPAATDDASNPGTDPARPLKGIAAANDRATPWTVVGLRRGAEIPSWHPLGKKVTARHVIYAPYGDAGDPAPVFIPTNNIAILAEPGSVDLRFEGIRVEVRAPVAGGGVNVVADGSRGALVHDCALHSGRAVGLTAHGSRDFTMDGCTFARTFDPGQGNYLFEANEGRRLSITRWRADWPVKSTTHTRRSSSTHLEEVRLADLTESIESGSGSYNWRYDTPLCLLADAIISTRVATAGIPGANGIWPANREFLLLRVESGRQIEVGQMSGTVLERCLARAATAASGPVRIAGAKGAASTAFATDEFNRIYDCRSAGGATFPGMAGTGDVSRGNEAGAGNGAPTYPGPLAAPAAAPAAGAAPGRLAAVADGGPSGGVGLARLWWQTSPDGGTTWVDHPGEASAVLAITLPAGAYLARAAAADEAGATAFGEPATIAVE